ncbi:MAG TPA: Sec-independent protein translocase protein TatB [Woeseiaceae bacterium]|nr:Sec-independent protein translocase protein TatB [Woeseiaceae bacterium]
MSGIGFWELILVFLIGLIVLGPERLPRVAHQLGTWLGQARRMSRAMRRQLEDEINLEKDLSIRPRSQSLPPPAHTPRPQDKNDTHSPAHDAAVPGTGNPRAADAESRSDAPESESGLAEGHPAEPPAKARNP